METLNDRSEYIKKIKDLLPSNPMCMEIGVWYGDFSRTIYDGLNPDKLYLIDPF